MFNDVFFSGEMIICYFSGKMVVFEEFKDG